MSGPLILLSAYSPVLLQLKTSVPLVSPVWTKEKSICPSLVQTPIVRLRNPASVSQRALISQVELVNCWYAINQHTAGSEASFFKQG
ncbi:hypothetical protein FKM82_025635 [Ascaphus truei]